ncbi:hypothetical protein P7K49_016245 [Saguinus oedipus]|uniref:Uncharacterized protein n=1 Tax=Saguinus oedipus TaxID=9490 RepID=A0ABQ9VC34_SAGOE|nr:hypothetical protein P7K49_016245 [Saguinus oedipus]
MSERRRSAVALSSRAHAFSVEALIGSNKKRKLRDWEEKGLDLSMEALSPAGPLGDTEDAAAHGLEPHPGHCGSGDLGLASENSGGLARHAADRGAEEVELRAEDTGTWGTNLQQPGINRPRRSLALKPARPRPFLEHQRKFFSQERLEQLLRLRPCKQISGARRRHLRSDLSPGFSRMRRSRVSRGAK